MREVLDGSREVFRTKARSFWWAARLLPKHARDDAALVYAFCRLVDDTADESDDPRAAGVALEALSNEISGIAEARPLVAEFRAMASRVNLPLESAQELIAGARGDLGVVRVADDAELVRYCYRVASTVGLMMCAVLGVRRREALPHAVDLGIAMQLTNICRDVAEDAARGRVYLPAARLARVGVTPDDLVRGRASAHGVAQVVSDILSMADGYYRSADGGMRDIPPRFRLAILVASRVYGAIGVRLRRRRCDALAGRTVVPWPEKLVWTLRAAVTALAPDMRGTSPRFAHDPTLHSALRGLPGADG